MIKLKNILGEIETERGDFNSNTGPKLFRGVFHESNPRLDNLIDGDFDYGFYFVKNSKQMNKIMQSAAEQNKKMPKEIRDKIISSFGKIISSNSDIFVTLQKSVDDGDNLYHMFDFSKPVKIVEKDDSEPTFAVNFYVGNMSTHNIGGNLEYSPNKQLGLSNTQQVKLSQIGIEYRGQGYGSLLYDTVSNSVDAIYSDNTLFRGSIPMWTKHMKKRAKFFGAILSDSRVIIPISGEINKKDMDYAKGFIAIFRKVPSKLIELQKFLSGISIEYIAISGVIDNSEISVSRIVDTIDEVGTLSDFNEAVTGGDLNEDYVAGIYLHQKATFVVKEVGDELDYMII